MPAYAEATVARSTIVMPAFAEASEVRSTIVMPAFAEATEARRSIVMPVFAEATEARRTIVMPAFAEATEARSTIVMPAFAEATEVRSTIVIPAQAGIQLLSKEADLYRQPCVYILANRRNGTLYTGVTSNLVKRIWEHKNHFVEGFTKKYSVTKLVWYEAHENMESAIRREKAIKNWKRAWKIKVIEEKNPQWQDLYLQLL